MSHVTCHICETVKQFQTVKGLRNRSLVITAAADLRRFLSVVWVSHVAHLDESRMSHITHLHGCCCSHALPLSIAVMNSHVANMDESRTSHVTHLHERCCYHILERGMLLSLATNALQHTATHCNTLQHTATHILQRAMLLSLATTMNRNYE